MKMVMSEQTYKEYPHHLDNPKNIKLIKALRSLSKSKKRLIKQKSLRIWVEQNPKVNVLNYPYYRYKDRAKIKELRKELF